MAKGLLTAFMRIWLIQGVTKFCWRIVTFQYKLVFIIVKKKI